MTALSLTLVNDLAEVGRLAEAVEAFCEANDLPMAAAHALALSLDELLTNTISYGYEDGAAGRIEVTITIAEGAARAVVRDDARPFDPTGPSRRTWTRPSTTAPWGGWASIWCSR